MQCLDAVIVARCVSGVAGIGSVLLVGALGRRMESKAAGLAAAALLAVVPIEVTQTHYVSVDVLQNVFITLTLIAGCAPVVGASHLWAALGGVGAGLAFATKYNALLAGAAPAWAILEIAWRRRSVLPLLTMGTALAGGLLAAVTLGCPPCVLNPDRLAQAISFHTSTSFSSAAASFGANPSPEIGWHARPYVYRLVAGLPFALGWPLALLALVGVVAAVRRGRATDRVVLAALVASFVVIARSPIVYPRYLLPLVPPLVVLAAIAVVQGREPRPGERRDSRRLVWLAIAALVWLYSAAFAWSLTGLYSHRQQAAVGAWLRVQAEACAARGVRLSVGYPKSNYYALDEFLRQVDADVHSQHPGSWFATVPDVFIVPDWAATNIRLRRLYANAELERDLRRLEDPAGEYVRVARWSSRYLQEGFYTRLDPSFATALERGEIGFSVYARRSLACIDRSAVAAP